MQDSRDLALQAIAGLVRLLTVDIRELRTMSATVDSKLDELAGVIDALQTGVTAEIQQLTDALAANSGNLSPAAIARFDGIRNRLQAMVEALNADDAAAPPPPPPVLIDPAALANAIAEARTAGATDVQLQVILNLGDGTSPQITKTMLADAVTAAQAAASDGSAPADATMLAGLIALST